MSTKRRYCGLSRGVILLNAVLLSICACSSRPQPQIERQSDGYKVSVKSDGRQVSNYSQRLVHRVTLQSTDLLRLTENGPKGLPFSAKTNYDNNGKPAGVRVVKVTTDKNAPRLGLQPKDLITAVEKSHTNSTNDMWQLFKALQKHRKATLTLVRGGKPHKILYSIR